MKIKRILSLLAATAMAATAVTGAMSVSASEVASGKCGDNVTWTLDSDGVLTLSGEGPMYFSNDDGYHNTYKDWEYSEYASQVKELIVEEGVTTIGPSAFGHTSTVDSIEVAYPNLKKITLPSTMKKLQRAAFMTSVVENITLPENIEIGSYAFDHSLLKNVTIPKGAYVKAEAFSYCKSLKEVTLNGNVSYGHGSGWGSENHTESIFNYCTALEKVTVLGPGTVIQRFDTVEKGLPNDMFYGCTALTEVIIRCDDLEYVGKVSTNGANSETFPHNGTFGMKYENKIKYYIIENSTTEKTLKNAGYITNTSDNYEYILGTSALEAVIAQAEEAIASRLYTDETVAALEKAVNKGYAVMNDPASVQKDIDMVIRNINNAIEALELRPDGPKPPDESDPSDPSTPSDPSKPSESDPSDSSDPTNPSKPTNPTNPTGGNVKKTTSPAQKASEAKAAAEKAIKQAKITSLTAKAKGKKKITVSWKKVAKAAGYEVQASTKKNFKKDAINKATTKNKIVIKKLKSKKKYFVRVRAYATYKDAKGKTQKVYSKWFKSNKKVKVK